MEKTIIDKTNIEKLSQMITSKDDETSNLVIKIVDNCDIDKSFLYILILISQNFDSTKTMGTRLIKSKNLYKHIKLLLKGAKNIPLNYDISLMVSLYEKHCSYLQQEINPREVKYLCKMYDGKEINERHYHTINVNKLKPKKNGKRK